MVVYIRPTKYEKEITTCTTYNDENHFTDTTDSQERIGLKA